MRISKRTALVVRLVVPFIRATVFTGDVRALADLTVDPKSRIIAREVLRRDLARRARADIRTYWATLAKDGDDFSSRRPCVPGDEMCVDPYPCSVHDRE